jgi:N-acetylmuramic acid 6-phosphate etherase
MVSMGGSTRLVLGIEGGGTKTEWVLLRRENAAGTIVDRGRLPAGNLRRASDDVLRALFRSLPKDATHVGAYLAGCGTEADRLRLRGLVQQAWPEAAVSVGSDRDSSLATCFGDGDGIVVIAGTGSAVTGRKAGRIEKAGGRGHLLGDKGGAYDLVLEGLCAALKSYDLEQRVTPLAAKMLRALAINRLDALTSWTQAADTAAIAGVVPLVFEAAVEGDAGARAAIDDGALTLAQYAAAIGRRLEIQEPQVQLAGGVFSNQPPYVRAFSSALEKLWPGAAVSLSTESGALGAAWLVEREHAAGGTDGTERPAGSSEGARASEAMRAARIDELAAALTETRNPRSAHLQELTAVELVALFVDEEKYVDAALRAVTPALADAVELAATSVKAGGRLFYVGAGTSGRLGVLDASEIPPTFGMAPEQVQGIIAGGAPALHSSIEGAEDRAEEGAGAIAERAVRTGDVVCGIAASGRTPFVLGALGEARRLGARTILLTCNPARRRAAEPWDVEIDLPTGPELVTGSTRLKAGTATKVALNILSTGAMIRLGRVKGNLLVDMQTTNAKLRDRAARLVAQELGCSYDDAIARLAACGWDIRRAVSRP